MKIKTSELTGPALDWAVAKITNPEWGEEGWVVHCRYPDDDGWLFSPSTNWSQGGPIIAQHTVLLEDLGDFEWEATAVGGAKARGDSVLQAACRAYVASKLGDEVDVPEELLSC